MAEQQELLTTEQAAQLLGLSPLTLNAQRCLGQRDTSIPVVPWVKLSRRCVRYRRTDIEKYISEMKPTTT